MFWQKFYDLCVENHTTPSVVVAKLGIANGSTTKWKNGATPSGKNLVKVAEFFNVPVDYFTAKEKAALNEAADGRELMLIQRFRSLSDKEKDTFLDLLHSMIKNEK